MNQQINHHPAALTVLAGALPYRDLLAIGVLLVAWLIFRSFIMAGLADLEQISGRYQYNEFLWSSRTVTFPASPPVTSLRLIGRAPVGMGLEIGCAGVMRDAGWIEEGVFFDRTLGPPADCAGQPVTLHTDRPFDPGRGSGDPRELALQVFAVWVNGAPVGLSDLQRTASGLHPLELIDIDTSPLAVLTDRWDAGWYRKIVTPGYRYLDDSTLQQSTAWPFLYPAIVTLIARLMDLDVRTAMVQVNAMLLLAAMIAIYGLGRAVALAPATALLPVLWLCFNPFSYYLVAGVSEPLFLFLEAMCLLFFVRGWYWPAVVTAGLMVATRFAGIAALSWTLLALILLHRGGRDGSLLVRLILGSAIISLGVVVDMVVKYQATGYLWSAFTVRGAWQPSDLVGFIRGIDLGEGLASVLLLTLLIGLALMVVAGIRCYRQMPAAQRFLWLSGISLIGFTMLANLEWNSMGRYLLAAFPLVIVYLARERIAERHAVLGLMLGIGGAGAVINTMRIWQGLPPF